MPSKQPTWPATGSRSAWLTCTADWALLLSPDSEDRWYAHFVLQAYAEAGRAKAVDALVKRLLPPRSRQARDLVHVAMNARAIAQAYLVLGNEAKARAHLEPLNALAAKQKKKSDAEYLRGEVSKFCRENGLMTADEMAALEPRERVMSEYTLANRAARRGDRAQARRHAVAAQVARAAGWVDAVFELLVRLGAKREALALYRKASATERRSLDPKAMVAVGLRRQAVAAQKAEVEAAFSEFVPTEWNLHSVMSDLKRAVDELRALKRDDLAKVALDVALDRMATGQFDSRGFASAGAYITLAEMVFAQRGWAAAEPWLTRALGVCGPRDRPITVPAMVEAATAMNQYDRALEWAAAAPRKTQFKLRAKVLYRAGRWRELRQTLATLKRSQAAEAAQLAWALTPEVT